MAERAGAAQLAPPGRPSLPPSPAAQPLLELRGIQKAHGRRALWPEPLDLVLRAGETVALTGPNGSGKSTLLRIAALLQRPSAGTVLVAGRDGRKDPASARRDIGVLLQDAPVYAELTPHEHLVWWGRMRGLTPPRANGACADEELTDAGLAHLAHKPAAALSRGQRQRLAILLAMTGRPRILLLDEPATALDDAGQAWLRAALERRSSDPRLATVMAVHGGDATRDLATRTLQLGARPPAGGA